MVMGVIGSVCVFLYLWVFIAIHLYKETEREREKESNKEVGKHPLTRQSSLVRLLVVVVVYWHRVQF